MSLSIAQRRSLKHTVSPWITLPRSFVSAAIVSAIFIGFVSRWREISPPLFFVAHINFALQHKHAVPARSGRRLNRVQEVAGP